MSNNEEFPPRMPISTAKSKVFDNLTNGTCCPVCNQMARLYPRKLTKPMVKALWAMAKVQVEYYPNHAKMWVHLPSLGFKGGDPAKMKHWHLIEPQSLCEEEKREGQKRTSGFWRLTQNGWNFLEGTAKVPKIVYLYNNQRFGSSDERITIEDAFGTDFNYQELMSRSKPG